MLPDPTPRAAALSAIRNSGVLLHTYAIPWHAMNTTSSVRNLYQLMMVQGDRDEDSYAGATRAVINQLPHAIPNAAASNYDHRTMFILPLSPWHLCFASVLLDPLAMSLKQPHVSAKLSQNLQSRWKNRSQLPPVEEIMGFVKYGSRTCMRTSRVWPRSNHTFPFTCRAFEAAVQWTVDQHTWAEAPERHVWMFEWPHYLRAALAAERHATGGAQSLQGKMALGLLLTQEDRLPDWQVQALSPRGHVVLVPFYSPRYFMYPASEPAATADVARTAAATDGPAKDFLTVSSLGHTRAGPTAELEDQPHAALLSQKDILAASSSGHAVTCHRFDHGYKRDWACTDAVMSDAKCVRRGLARAASLLTEGSTAILSHGGQVQHLDANLSRQPRPDRQPEAEASVLYKVHHLKHRTSWALQRKAALYIRSVFCLVPPGDTIITPRIFSYVAACACSKSRTHPGQCINQDPAHDR